MSIAFKKIHDIDKLKTLMKTYSAPEVARLMGVTKNAIYWHEHRLGIKCIRKRRYASVSPNGETL